MRVWLLISLIFISCISNIEEDMGLFEFQGSLPSQVESLGYFEDIYLRGQARVESRCRINNGVLEVLEVYTDKVLLSTYVTDTGDSTGEYIQFGMLYLHNRDDGAANGYGTKIIDITYPTVQPFAFSITGYEWFPYHGYKTMWSFDGNIPPINIDGTDYDLYADTLTWQTFNTINITQSNFAIKTIGAFSGTPDRVTDGIMEITTVLTITPQQLIQEIDFEVTQENIYNLGYTPMHAANGTNMKYLLVQNGNKVNLQQGVNETIYYDTDIYQFGYNSDNNYGCAVITDNSNMYWTLPTTPAERRLVCTDSGVKRKLYYVMMHNHTPALGSTYNTSTKYIWGKANGFMDIYNSAPVENP